MTPTSAGGGRAWTCDVSEDVSFGSVGESFDQTVEEEVVEEEGTFPTCDCGEENCTLVEMHARGGPFALPVRDIPSRSAREVTESIVETDEEREDDEESIAGTEVDDIESLGAAVDALELIDEESEDQTVVVDEVVLEEACIDDDVEIVEEVAEVPGAQTGTHIRFEDSPLVNRDASRSPRVSPNVRRSRNRTARRGAILDSDEEDSLEDESSEANEDEDASSPAVSARPRRATTREPSFTFKNAFIDDDLSGSEEFEYDEEAHTSDDDFIADEDDEDGEYRVEYDSDAENVTPAPRKPTTETDISKEVAEKLVIDEYSPSNLHTPTPPKELSPTPAVKAFRPPPSHSKALQSALKSVAKKGHAKFNFNRHKDALTSALFEEFNESVFDGALPLDFTVTWNNKLLTTAGLTHYKRSSKSGETTYSARIELSTKVLDTVEKLEATLLHEMCHASLGSSTRRRSLRTDQSSKSGRNSRCLCTLKRASARVTRTRSISRTSGDAREIGVNKNTVDTASQSTSRRKDARRIRGGKLEYLGKFKKNGDVIQSRAPTAFSLFVKEHFKDAKSKLGASTPHKDVMKHLSQRWKLETTKETAKVIDVSD